MRVEKRTRYRLADMTRHELSVIQYFLSMCHREEDKKTSEAGARLYDQIVQSWTMGEDE